MRVLTLVPLLLLLAYRNAAQVPTSSSSGHELYAGSWELNTKKSTESVLPDSAEWTVSLAGAEFRVLRNLVMDRKAQSYEMILVADGRGETNIVPARRSSAATKVRSSTKWEKNALLRRYAMEMRGVGPDGRQSGGEAEATEKYTLSRDSGQMFVETTIYFRGISSTRGKLVFDRKK